MTGEVKPIAACTEAEISAMYRLMDTFYDNMCEEVFRRDFFSKDYCLVLYAEDGTLCGFTTQKLLTVPVNGKEVRGMFSGDTIIHKEHWGDIALFRIWADFWFPYAAQYDAFYWFLISKGYKTYRILPLFWREFYPTFRCATPAYEKQIIDAYASMLYPDEYNPQTGVIEYRTEKDRLKPDVAAVDARQLKNRDTAFFCQANPNHAAGNDLACLAKIDRALLKQHAAELLFR